MPVAGLERRGKVGHLASLRRSQDSGVADEPKPASPVSSSQQQR
jgi:hypothetical protein